MITVQSERLCLDDFVGAAEAATCGQSNGRARAVGAADAVTCG